MAGRPGEIDGDTITAFQSVAGQNTGDSLVILRRHVPLANDVLLA